MDSLFISPSERDEWERRKREWGEQGGNVLRHVGSYGVARVTLAPTTMLLSRVASVELLPATLNLVTPPIIYEPVYDSATQSLILTDDFNGYADLAAANVFYNVGRNHQFCELISPGLGGSGKALRLNYGIGFTDDILWGTENKLHAVGAWNGTLPEVAAPYEHFFFTTSFRFSAGADPVDHDGTGSGIKGFMFWHLDGSRNEISITRLSQTGSSRIFKIFNPSNAQSGLNVWKTSDGMAPLMSSYADANWHRFTCEFKVGPLVAANERGVRIWVDSTLIYDDMGIDVQTGQTYPGYSYSAAIAWFTVFGNFFSVGASSNPFTLDIDSWTSWTD